MINVAIIGLGYWGPNLLRNFNSTPGCNVMFAVDQNNDKLKKLKISYKNIEFTSDFDKVINHPNIHAVVIATPVSSHYSIAKKALEHGKHVLIEKPMTTNIADAVELKKIAVDNQLLLMVDHTLLYTGAVKKIKEIVNSGELGAIKYYDSTRINLGLFQSDVNVIWDLAPHDIAVLKYIVNEKPYSVQAIGASHNPTGLENIAFLNIKYHSGLVAHFNCSWVSPIKVRQTIIGGDKKMLVYNDLETKEKVRVYDMGYKMSVNNKNQMQSVEYKNGDVHTPKIDTSEALSNVAADFIFCITNNQTPQSNGGLGLEVMRILEASKESLKDNGKSVIL